MSRRLSYLLLTTLLFLAMFVQMMGSIRVKSATYDEQTYYARGYAVLKTGDMRLRLRHPLLTNLISATPLLLLPDLRLPTDHRSWANAEFHEFSAQFLWVYNKERADQIIFLSRWPMMLLTMLLAAVIYRWANELYGPQAGLLALTLVAFDPNLIAHGRLANTDIGSTVFIFIATYAFWRYQRRPDRRGLVLSGVTFGLAQTTRFTALLLGPVFGSLLLVEIWRATPGQRWQSLGKRLVALVTLGLIGLATIWAVYGFSWGSVDGIGVSLPAPGHWNEFQSLRQRLSRSDPAFLMGEIYRGGHWAYFFVAWLVKTPLPTLGLIGWAGLVALRRRQLDDLYLLVPAGAYFTSAVFSSLNTGYRLILPVLPFLLVFAGRVASGEWQAATIVPDAKPLAPVPLAGDSAGGSESDRLVHRTGRQRLAFVRGGLILALMIWLVVDAATIYPDYLAFFNVLAGGPDGGYRLLVDSNLDWGQDLPGLRRYQATHGQRPEPVEGDEPFYLSWFGIAPPEHYGLRYRYLPGFPPFEDPATRIYHPERPLPGLYAISATHLQGVLLDDPDTFAWFRRQAPTARIGHSIFLYRVPPDGPAYDVALAGVRLDQIPSDLLDERFASNNLRLRWFDARHSLVLMGDPTSDTYFIADDQQAAAPWWARFLDQDAPIARGAGYTLYRPVEEARIAAQIEAIMNQSPVETPQAGALPLSFADQIAFLGYELTTPTVKPGEQVHLITYWRVLKPVSHPLKIFVHLLDAQNQILGQHDGLDVPVAGWHLGDVVMQRHIVTTAPDAPPGHHWIQVGLYNPGTMERLPVVGDDGAFLGERLLLHEVTVE